MKMSSRHRSMMVLMIVAVSVFLSSCGIPTYFSPSNSQSTVINKLSEGFDSDGNRVLNFNVRIEHYPEDIGENAPKIGLLLLYVYSDSTNGSLYSELVKKFNSNYRGSIPHGVSTLTASIDNPVWDFAVDDANYEVYAFTDSNNAPVSAYKYNLDISSTSNINTNYSLKREDTITNGVVLSKVNGSASSEVARYGFGLPSKMNELERSQYIHVYAAISAQGKQFSNLYWSDLEYIGSFNAI